MRALRTPRRHGARIQILLALGLTAWSCGGASREEVPPKVTEGFVEADDGVQLYYKSVGEGEQTVVIPVGLYLEDLLTPLAKNRRLVFYNNIGDIPTTAGQFHFKTNVWIIMG